MDTSLPSSGSDQPQKARGSTPDAIKRSPFFTVVCAVCLIASGGLLIRSAIEFFEHSAKAASKRTTLSRIQGGAQVGDFSTATNSFRPYTAASVQEEYERAKSRATFSLTQGIACIVSLLGLSLMWRRKRSGFFLFAIGLLAFLILQFAIANPSSDRDGFVGEWRSVVKDEARTITDVLRISMSDEGRGATYTIEWSTDSPFTEWTGDVWLAERASNELSSAQAKFNSIISAKCVYHPDGDYLEFMNENIDGAKRFERTASPNL